MGEDEFLESVDLILQLHEVCNGLVAGRTLATADRGLFEHITHPSFGSLIDFKLMYSSYSNVPLNSV